MNTETSTTQAQDTPAEQKALNATDQTEETTISKMVLTNKENNMTVSVDYIRMKKAAMILRAINHKLRQQILKLLDEKEKVTVTEIYKQLNVEQSVASQHLAILRTAGIVSTKRDGKFIFYSVDHKRIREVNTFIEAILA